ncbi:hypothetical protein [Streptomyces sp. NBC_01546]|uniref:hypothetical protein n=1 Tax=Streptomyces sp. NBC_01546 TaxID=2975872 RepID=UPI002F9071E5
MRWVLQPKSQYRQNRPPLTMPGSTVVDIVNNGFKDALAEILRRLADPHSFGEQVRYLADRQGVPREAVDDSRALFDAFWRTTTGVTAGTNWMNAAGVPERSRSYVEQIKPLPADIPTLDGHDASRWAFGLNLPLTTFMVF